MKILMINVVCGIRSTGRICTDLATALDERGHEVKIAYGREKVPEEYKKYAVKIGNDLDVKLHAIRARLLDGCGWGSKKATEKFIKWVKEYEPDVIHLHNIHGYYINIEVLFEYLRTCGKKVIWTLHDCWAFTGHAAYCEAKECNRWISGCNLCPKMRDYPSSILDRSKKNWLWKKKILTGIPNLLIITPSQWLANLTRKSFLCDYDVKVVHNGVDTSIFKSTKSGIKKSLGINNKKMILGVAAVWEDRKGLFDFFELAKVLNNDYKIVLVGLSAKQIKSLPDEIIGIQRTNTIQKLVELYSAAEVYVNPTYEDNYPTTNIEAISCGIPVITYDTGGSPESANLLGKVINKGNVKKIYEIVTSAVIDKDKDIEAIRRIISTEACVKEYLKIYRIDL